MGENICKLCDRQGLNFQNILTAHNKKTNNSIKNGQNTQIDISSKKIYRWPIGT